VVGIGDVVPGHELVDDRGETWRLDAARDRPLVLIFHRHFY
jgi:peroxiredoxin